MTNQLSTNRINSQRIRALWVTVGDSNLASTRVRVLELSRGLREFQVESTITRGPGLGGRLRVAIRVITGRYEVIVLQKVLYGVPMLWLLRTMTRSLVFECDDAIHLPDSAGALYATGNDLRRLRRILEQVDVVTTTNDLLADDFATTGTRSAIFAGPAPPVTKVAKEKRIVLWLGSPSTSPELDEVGDVPSELKTDGIEFVAIGADHTQQARGWTVLDWSIDIADEWLRRATVGLMPLSRTPWNDRKAGYKILQYAAYGVVPIASDGPPARRLLASTMEECLVADRAGWKPAIEAGLEGSDKYAPMLDKIVARNTVESAAKRWFHEVVEKGG